MRCVELTAGIKNATFADTLAQRSSKYAPAISLLIHSGSGNAMIIWGAIWGAILGIILPRHEDAWTLIAGA